MHIGIDVSQAIFGTGVSDYTFDLVRSFQQVDPTNRYTLFASSLRRTRDLKRLFPSARTFSFPPMFLDLLWNRLHVVNIESFIGQVDVFHSSDWTQPPASCPKVTTVHDLSPFIYPDEMASGIFRNISSVHRARMRWVTRECDRIICVSAATASDLQRLFSVPDSKIQIIPEALPSRFAYHPPRSHIASTAKKWGLSDYLITIGTPQPRKNITRLIQAYLSFQVPLRLPSHLVIVGGHGWGISDIPDDNRLIFTGYLPDKEVGALLAGARAFVFPSLYEGFGLPVLMAFYHRVPVVTSAVSSLPQVAGQAAVLVDPSDTHAIADGISQALKHRRHLIAAGTRQLAKFSWEDTARQTLLVYSQLC